MSAGRQDDALELIKKAINIWEKGEYGNDHLYFARIKAAKGDCHFAREQTEEALKEYEFALNIYRQKTSPSYYELGDIFFKVGQIKQSQGDTTGAEKFYKDAKFVIEKRKNPDGIDGNAKIAEIDKKLEEMYSWRAKSSEDRQGTALSARDSHKKKDVGPASSTKKPCPTCMVM